MQLLIAVLLFLFSTFMVNPSPHVGVYEPVAVIELFTSQGCSSCPPADRLLSQTIDEASRNGKKIYALSFHVDYWNRLGWADPFSDATYSARQNMYAHALHLQSVYTPQMLVNGQDELVGSDEPALSKALNKNLSRTAMARFNKLEVTPDSTLRFRVDYEVEGEFANCTLNAALISLSETTSISRGENQGRTLTNQNVVRQLVTGKAETMGHFDVTINPAQKPANTAIVVFLQRSSDLRIVGAATSTLQNNY
jgi:hypothetical protein